MNKSPRSEIQWCMTAWRTLVLALGLGLLAMGAAKAWYPPQSGERAFFELIPDKCIVLEYIDINSSKIAFLPLHIDRMPEWIRIDSWKAMEKEFAPYGNEYFRQDYLWENLQNNLDSRSNAAIPLKDALKGAFEYLNKEKILKKYFLGLEPRDDINPNLIKKAIDSEIAVFQDAVEFLNTKEKDLPFEIKAKSNEMESLPVPLLAEAARMGFKVKVNSDALNYDENKSTLIKRAEVWPERAVIIFQNKNFPHLKVARDFVFYVSRAEGSHGGIGSLPVTIVFPAGLLLGLGLGIAGSWLLRKKKAEVPVTEREMGRPSGKGPDAIEESIKKAFNSILPYDSIFASLVSKITALTEGLKNTARIPDGLDLKAKKDALDTNLNSIQQAFSEAARMRQAVKEKMIALREEMARQASWSGSSSDLISPPDETAILSEIRQIIEAWARQKDQKIQSQLGELQRLNGEYNKAIIGIKTVLTPFGREEPVSTFLKKLGENQGFDLSDPPEWARVIKDRLDRLQPGLPLEAKVLRYLLEQALQKVRDIRAQEAGLLGRTGVDREYRELDARLDEFAKSFALSVSLDGFRSLVLSEQERNDYLDDIWTSELLKRFDTPIQLIHRIIFRLRFLMSGDDPPSLWPLFLASQSVLHLMQGVVVCCQRIYHDLVPFDPVDLGIVTKEGDDSVAADAQLKRSLDRVEVDYENIVSVKYWGWTGLKVGLGVSRSRVTTRIPRRRSN